MDLVNAITRFQLNALRPRPLVADFDWSDVAGGSVLLGTCPAGHIVDKTIVSIENAFNGGVQITVGDSVAQARLQAIIDNVPYVSSYYEVNNSYEYTATTELKIFFPGGNPTAGSGRVLIYLD